MTETKDPDDIRLKISVTLSREALDLLRSAAEEHGTTASAVVELLIRCMKTGEPLLNPALVERIQTAEL